MSERREMSMAGEGPVQCGEVREPLSTTTWCPEKLLLQDSRYRAESKYTFGKPNQKKIKLKNKTKQGCPDWCDSVH